MIKNPDILEQFEKERIRKEKLSFRKASKIFEAMWKEGVSLGVFATEESFRRNRGRHKSCTDSQLFEEILTKLARARY